MGVKIAVLVGTLLVACSVDAEQRWQCGDGLSVPLEGTRQDRDEACEKLRASTSPPAGSGVGQNERTLEERIQQLEKRYGVNIEVEIR